KHLQVIVVRLLESEHTIARIVARVNNTESAQTRADIRVRLDYVERDRPKVRAARRWVVSIHAINEPVYRKLAAQQQHTKKQTNQQRPRHPGSHGNTLQRV